MGGRVRAPGVGSRRGGDIRALGGSERPSAPLGIHNGIKGGARLISPWLLRALHTEMWRERQWVCGPRFAGSLEILEKHVSHRDFEEPGVSVCTRTHARTCG